MRVWSLRLLAQLYDTSMLWDPSEFDARHIVAINYLYELPFFRGHRGFVGKALGGWQISGITQFQTGLPCSVAAAVNYAELVSTPISAAA